MGPAGLGGGGGKQSGRVAAWPWPGGIRDQLPHVAGAGAAAAPSRTQAQLVFSPVQPG